MTPEDQHFDRKSLRKVTGRSPAWAELALDCVCFANAAGGRLLIGIEDGQDAPPPEQAIAPDLPETLLRRVRELTVNVEVAATVERHANGGAFITLRVARAPGLASTSDGRYALRIGPECKPVVGDDVTRLLNDRPARPWELQPEPGVQRQDLDPDKCAGFVAAIRASDRVKASVKEKSVDELLAHYDLLAGGTATRLGVLLLGQRQDRAALGTAPVVQCLKFDEHGARINKWLWDDYSLSPVELVEAVWRGVPDFREAYDLPDGLYRSSVPAYDEKVLRELLVNALVHRPYTQRGDIFLNLHPDRLEVVNPGRLPLGVTPQTILHASRRRNDALARVFHDLGLMEREGSGYDLMYEQLLAADRPPPALVEGVDSVAVTVQRRRPRPQVVALIEGADQRYQLNQRERITLGVLAQADGLTAQELCRSLELQGADALKPWLGRLPALGLVQTSGRTRAQRYFVAPELLRSAKVPTTTSLARIAPHRLRALILEDLERYPGSSSPEINARLGTELSVKTVKRALDELEAAQAVRHQGERRWRRYWAVGHSARQGQPGGETG
ncbi:MAG: ATP-dependent DNA helicase [Burkholderiales bacterium]|nr:ATP-dependent DNA helicase [Burkholderiales bacterium]